MAVDTRNKRMSVVTLATSQYFAGPNPDGSLATEADRQQMAYQYSGIQTTAPSVTLLDFERGYGRGMARGMSLGAR